MEITIYHNPGCGTSLNALAAIRAAGHEPRVHDYLQSPLSRDAIADLVARMNVTPRSIVRNREALFGELELDDKSVTEDALLDAMATHPILMNRPIVVVKVGTRVTVRLCRPSERVKTLLAEASGNA